MFTGSRSERVRRPPRYEFLGVPERAVIDTGSKKIVYVEREPGMFEGVEVELGPRHGQYYPVVKGLKAGDKVAAAGGFLIDAETRLNPAAASTYFGASGGPQSSDQPATAAPAPSQSAPADQASRTRSAEGRTEANGSGAAPTAEDLKNIEQLPEADRPLALANRICPLRAAWARWAFR